MCSRRARHQAFARSAVRWLVKVSLWSSTRTMRLAVDVVLVEEGTRVPIVSVDNELLHDCTTFLYRPGVTPSLAENTLVRCCCEEKPQA